jgi:hypothetical protein
LRGTICRGSVDGLGQENTDTEHQRSTELATARKEGLVTGGLMRWDKSKHHDPQQHDAPFPWAWGVVGIT